jgi:hypothetical protein
MSDIQKLSQSSSFTAGDQIPFFSLQNGGDRRGSVSALISYINGFISFTDDKVTEYSAPNATGFAVTLSDNSSSRWLVLTPAAGYAAGTIVLPTSTNCVEKQEILVNCTQDITTLTISGNGATVTGAPTSITANDYFLLRFEPVTDTWYRVG